MAQDLVFKRRAIASQAVDQGTALLDAALALTELAQEKAQAGDGTNDDYAAYATAGGISFRTVEPQLTDYLLNLILSNVVTDLNAWLDTAAYQGGATRRQLLQQIRR